MKKLVVIIFGIIAVGIGIFSIINAKELSKRCTVEAVGTVVGINVEEGTEEEDGYIRTVYTYYPVLEYNAGDKTVSKQSNSGSNSPTYKVNDKIDILYNPDNVEEYIIKGDTSSNIVGIIFIVAGVVITIVGIIKRF